MIGPLVPVVLIPRYTSYVGKATYVTIPLPVSEFKALRLEFWCGTLAVGAVGATFDAYLEESMNPDAAADDWTELWTTDQPNERTLLDPVTLTCPYLRVRIVLDNTNYGGNGYAGAGICCWAAGYFERRVPGGSA